MSHVPYHIIIPARLASTRLPRKVLIEIAGKTMLQHVYEIACCSQARSVLIATDAEEIKDLAEQWGARCQLTDPSHPHGTSRISEILQNTSRYEDNDIIIGLQADEPLLPVAWLDDLATFLSQDSSAVMATLAATFNKAEDFLDPSKVKVVLNEQKDALYFSRSPIPWQQQSIVVLEAKVLSQAYWHIGLYAYRAQLLKNLNHYVASPLEELEQLEQLRWLWHGIKIKVAIVQETPMPSVNTPEELAVVRAYLEQNVQV